MAKKNSPVVPDKKNVDPVLSARAKKAAATRAANRAAAIFDDTPAPQPAPPAQTPLWQNIGLGILAVLLAILAIACIVAVIKQAQAYDAAGNVLARAAATQQQQAAPVAAPTAQAPKAFNPAGNGVKPPAAADLAEIVNTHVNGGIEFDLEPGANVNGGHIFVNGNEFLFVGGKVVVVTNNSTKIVKINSTDGVGWANTVDFNLAVKARFVEGCDPDGCDQILWVNVTDDKGIEAKVIDREGYVKDYVPAATAPTAAPKSEVAADKPAETVKTVAKCPEGATSKPSFDLPAGCSANAGHLSYGDKNPVQKDGSVVLIRNASDKEIVVNTTSGASYGGDVDDILKHGCGPSGCALVYYIEVTNSGSTLVERTK